MITRKQQSWSVKPEIFISEPNSHPMLCLKNCPKTQEKGESVWWVAWPQAEKYSKALV